MGRSYDIQDVVAEQLADLTAQRVADAVMGALQEHENEAEALRLLAQSIAARQTHIRNKEADTTAQPIEATPRSE